MSDYVYIKAIRTKINKKEIIERLGLCDIFDLERYISDLFGPSMVDSVKGEDYFEVGFGDDNYYLDYVLKSTYGTHTSDYGHCSKLSSEEYNKYIYIFARILDYKEDEKFSLCKVEYCYYNGSESTDYYEEYNYSQAKRRFLVMIKSEYVRDAQVYINTVKKNDDIYSDENENNWIDASGSLLIGDFIALYEEDVIKKITKLYPKADFSIFDIIEVVTEKGE